MDETGAQPPTEPAATAGPPDQTETIKRDLIALPDGTPFYLDELVALANAGPGELRTSVRDQNGVVHLIHVAARLALKPVEEIRREQMEAERQKQQRRPMIALPGGPFDPLAGGFR